MHTVPASAVSRPAMTRSRVDLPPPLGPSRAVNDPDGISTETSSRATKSPKRLVMLMASIPMSSLVLRAEDVHDQQGAHGQPGQQEGAGEGRRLVEVVVRPVHEEGGG